MTEKEFIKQNKASWQELEKQLERDKANPEVLQSLFVKISGDLSYARTFFPRRSVRIYLNHLVGRVFNKMKIRKKQNILKSLVNFYLKTLPEHIIYNKNAFLTSFAVFTIAILIGIFSLWQDPEFVYDILGHSYVSMTESNIANEDPMAVYKSMRSDSMFLAITVNNIRVAFLAFVLGITACIGTFYILVRNGIMIGVFQSFFYYKGLLATSFLTIWIHGTIEISSIIIAGAAGIILGNGILFTGTYSRGISIRRAATSAVYILISTIPLFIMAGFLESYITRLTGLPDAIKLSIILLSLIFVLGIYVINPILYQRKGLYSGDPYNIKKYEDTKSDDDKSALIKSAGIILDKGLDIIKKIVLPFLVILIIYGISEKKIFRIEDGLLYENNYDYSSPWLLLISTTLFPFFLLRLLLIINNKLHSVTDTIRLMRKRIIPMLFVAILSALAVIVNFNTVYIVVLITTIYPALVYGINKQILSDKDEIDVFFTGFLNTYKLFGNLILPVSGLCLLIIFGLNTYVFLQNFFLLEIINWHDVSNNRLLWTSLLNEALPFFFGSVFLAFITIFYVTLIKKTEDKIFLFDLEEKLLQFGRPKKVKV